MKKILQTACGLCLIACLILGFAQNPDGSCNLSWTLGFLSLAAFFGWAFGKLDKEGRSDV